MSLYGIARDLGFHKIEAIPISNSQMQYIEDWYINKAYRPGLQRLGQTTVVLRKKTRNDLIIKG